MDYRKNKNDIIKYEDIMHRKDLSFVLIDDWKMNIFEYALLKDELKESVDLIVSKNKERNIYLVFENKNDAFWFKINFGDMCRI